MLRPLEHLRDPRRRGHGGRGGSARPRRPRGGAAGAPARHHPGERHARQQRGGHGAAHRRDRPAGPRRRRAAATPTRPRASGRSRSRVDELGVDLLSRGRPQALRAQGRRRALRPARHPPRPPSCSAPATSRAGGPAPRTCSSTSASGAACELAGRLAGMAAVRALRDWFEAALVQRFGDRVTVNGARAERLPNTSSVNFVGRSGAAVLAALPGAGRLHRLGLPRRRGRALGGAGRHGRAAPRRDGGGPLQPRTHHHARGAGGGAGGAGADPRHRGLTGPERDPPDRRRGARPVLLVVDAGRPRVPRRAHRRARRGGGDHGALPAAAPAGGARLHPGRAHRRPARPHPAGRRPRPSSRRSPSWASSC